MRARAGTPTPESGADRSATGSCGCCWRRPGSHELIRTGQPITFRGLAQTAGVSLDFLYRTPQIRGRVEHLRTQQRTTPPAPPEHAQDHPSSVVRTLTAQLAELRRRHREEVHTLKQALETAHGENLELRRRLGDRHPPQTTETP